MNSVETLRSSRTRFVAGSRFVAIFTILAALLIPVRSPATIYTINRSFGSGSSFAALTGTLEIPQGSYLIMNGAGVANPFTAVNLTLVVNGTPYFVNHVHMDAIFGTGQFLINAGPATLNFNTANADGFNPADLAFSDNLNPNNLFNSYAIGYDYSPDSRWPTRPMGMLMVMFFFPRFSARQFPSRA